MTLKLWMTTATEKQIEQLARDAGTTVSYLQQLAGGHRRSSADMAGRLEQAIVKINSRSKAELPNINRTNLCDACSVCPFAQQHKENK